LLFITAQAPAPAAGAAAAPVSLSALSTIREVAIHTTAEDFATPSASPVVPAPEGLPEIYTVGIIDFLSRYQTFKKQTAHFFKSFLWTDDELSTVNSEFYSRRFENYLDVIFPPADAAVVSGSDAAALQRFGITTATVAKSGAGALVRTASGRAVVVLPEGVKSSPAMPRLPTPGTTAAAGCAGAGAATPRAAERNLAAVTAAAQQEQQNGLPPKAPVKQQ